MGALLECSLPPGGQADLDSFGPVTFAVCGFYSVSIVLHKVLKQEITDGAAKCSKF